MPGAYLVFPSNVEYLEQTLVSILLLHGVTLYPEKFLTRCVVCNGNIVEVHDRKEQKAIFDQYASPDLGEELDHVYKCHSCGQGYWWSSSPTSSASRVKDLCTHLLRLCLRGGIDIEGHPDFFSHVDYDEEKNIGKQQKLQKENRTICDNGTEEVLGWLKNSKLCSPFSLRSSYANVTQGEVDGEILPFTNVTSDFVGALDYILFETTLQQVGRLKIPTDFKTLNKSKVTNGHLLPSDEWPSDHLCIGSQFLLKSYFKNPRSSDSVESKSSIPRAYKYVPEDLLQSRNIFPATKSTGKNPNGNIPKAQESNSSIPSAYVPEDLLSSNIYFPSIKSKQANRDANIPEVKENHPNVDVSKDVEEHLCPQLGCECGCVPKILSLFQMAELRKQARAKKEKLGTSNN